MDFPWPITDGELLLDNTMARLLDSFSEDERALIRDDVARHLIHAYNEGVRDENILVRYAAKALPSPTRSLR
jgi:DNA invertase Pin-like site-specific DNA recombinase